MNALLDTLRYLIDHPDAPVEDAWVEEMWEAYPFFSLPAAMMLERGGDSLDDRRRKQLMFRVAVGQSSPEMLYRAIEDSDGSYAGFYPPESEQASPSTNEAITTFIDNYGSDDSREKEILERLIFNPVPDYAQILADEEERNLPSPEEAEGDSPDSVINAFILKDRDRQSHFSAREEEKNSQSPAPAKEEKKEPIQHPVMQEDSLLSESLAKIYIKQHRYGKAYEIITGLNLKYPEKSVYFADQLRFLQKLMINQQYKNKK